jgi:PIN domain nuclease of toxin-antitoxin system
MSEVAVTDTHALIWAMSGHLAKLGTKARKFYEAVDRGEKALYIPTICLVELGEAMHDGSVRLPGGLTFTRFVDRLQQSDCYVLVDLTADIVIASQGLVDTLERGDRLIAATAIALQAPLITRDPDIAKNAQVELLW